MASSSGTKLSAPPLRQATDTLASNELDVSKESDDTMPIEGAVPQEEEPEGGALGVRAVIGAFGISFCTWGFAGSWTVFQSHYEAVRLPTFSASQISWIGSVQICMVYLSSAVAGRLYDSGYLKTILICSCIVSTLGFMLASISSQYWHYVLTQGLLLGVGLGTSFTPALACVSSYYRKRRGLANGLLSAGSAIGGLIIPIFLSKMVDNPSIGLGWALRTSGFICLALQGMACFVMKQKKLPPNKRSLFDITVYRQRAYTMTVIALFMVTLALFYPIFYIQPFAESKGVDRGLVFYTIAILNGASLLGRIAPLIAADRFGPFNVLAITIMCSCIILYCFPAIQDFGGVVGFSVVNGIAYGCYVTVNPVVLANLSDHPSRIGTHIGMAYFTNGLAGLAGPPALGAVVSATGQYWQGAVIAGSCMLVAAVLLNFANLMVRTSRKTWRI